MDKISELMDGELDEWQVHAQLSRVKQDERLLGCWDTFHLIGDIIRGEPSLSKEFSDTLSARLAKEPAVLVPRRTMAKRITTYALSAAASLSAIALVGWVAFSNAPHAPQADLAKGPRTPLPAVAPAPQFANAPSDGKMSDYLIAHEEFSPSTAIQGLGPYIRSVSSTQGARDQ